MLLEKPSLLKSIRLNVLIALTAIAIATAAVVAIHSIDQPLVILGAIAAGIGLVIAFFKPELALLALVFMAFTRAPIVAPVIKDLPNLSMVLSLALALLLVLRRLLFEEAIEGWLSLVLLLGPYGLLALASMLWAREPDAAWAGLVEFFKDLTLAIVVAISIRRVSTLRHVIWALLLAGIFLGSISIFQQFTGNLQNDFFGFGQVRLMNIVGETSGYRIIGPGMEPNTYGLYMALLVPLAMDRLWVERKILLQVLALLAFAACSLTVIFTFSRGAFVTLIFAIGLFLILRPPQPALILSILLLSAVLWTFVPSIYIDRMSTLTYLVPSNNEDEPLSVRSGNVDDILSDVSFRGRLSENIAGIQMSLDHPLFGVGLDNFKAHYLDYSSELGLDSRREGRAAHNLFLEFSAEMGILGLVWFLFLNWIALRGLYKAHLDLNQLQDHQVSGLAAAFAVSLASFLVGSIFRHLVYPTQVWLLYAIILSIPRLSQSELAETLQLNPPAFHKKPSRGIPNG